eukprot:CAMPEP_0182522268 /NCGR_PEP_ID=MMETSP1323-20130603/164_1 /TAXON_ID=236787 /ORGANISM="Florenciella parvula, Strain RCC1693" /LENGTH=50 /DNA_ID=CAMNT_0024730357 /DNA_START=77 /DNA_END=225 /DNA_ORIENTATION=-
MRGSHTLYVLAVPWCTVLRHLRAATSTARQYTIMVQYHHGMYHVRGIQGR